MPLNSPNHPPYLNSTSGFDVDNITAVDMSFSVKLRSFIQKNGVMSFFKIEDLRHLGF